MAPETTVDINGNQQHSAYTAAWVLYASSKTDAYTVMRNQLSLNETVDDFFIEHTARLEFTQALISLQKFEAAEEQIEISLLTLNNGCGRA